MPVGGAAPCQETATASGEVGLRPNGQPVIADKLSSGLQTGRSKGVSALREETKNDGSVAGETAPAVALGL